MSPDDAGNTTKLVRAWLIQLAAGDPSARDALLTHTRQRLSEITQRQIAKWPGLSGWTEADDVLSEAYIRLMEYWDGIVTGDDGQKITEPGQYFARATRVINNVITDVYRRHKGRRGQRQAVGSLNAGSPDDSAAAIDPGSDTLDPAALARFTEFHRAVQELPEGVRAVFELRWYHGLKHHEIGAMLDINEATARRRWVEARLRLTKKLPGVRFDLE